MVSEKNTLYMIDAMLPHINLNVGWHQYYLRPMFPQMIHYLIQYLKEFIIFLKLSSPSCFKHLSKLIEPQRELIGCLKMNWLMKFCLK
jgi:hypothetical protein